MATVPDDPSLDPGLESGQQETTLRDDLDAAFAQHATDEVDEPAQRARDDLGRFTTQPPARAPGGPMEARSGAPGTPGPRQQPLAPQAGTTPELRAPASWTPSAREKWASVDPEIRQEIHRREIEAQRVLQDSAGLRQFTQSFQSIVAPYEMFIRAEQSDPLRAVASLMNTAAQLRVGTPQTKVGIVASIIQQHGIDLKMLDDYLAQALGVTEPGQLPQQPPRDPRVDQILAYQQQQQWEQQQAYQRREAWEDNAIRTGLSQFAQTHEFYGDVADTMADLVDAANRRGLAVDIEQIYARACQLDPQVSTILAQRAAGAPQLNGNGRTTVSPAVLRARRAAASVKGDSTPEGATVPKNDSIRSAIEAAFDQHSQ